jgi:hypothetical protein
MGLVKSGVVVILPSSSISNKHYTTQSVADKVVQRYVICKLIRMGIHNTQQHIYCGDIVVFLPDDLAYERGGR